MGKFQCYLNALFQVFQGYMEIKHYCYVYLVIERKLEYVYLLQYGNSVFATYKHSIFSLRTTMNPYGQCSVLNNEIMLL